MQGRWMEKKMVSRKIGSSRFRRSISIQSCFPETDSGCGSSEDSDTGVMNRRLSCEDTEGVKHSVCVDIHGCGTSQVHPAVLPRAATDGALSVEMDCLRPHDQQLTAVAQNSTVVPDTAVENDALVVPSPPVRDFGYMNSSISQTSSSYMKFTPAGVDDSSGFPFGAVPFSGTISGEIRNNGLKTYVELYIAALTGDWDFAKDYLGAFPQAVRAKITRSSETALHIAAGARHSKFVEELVKLMTPDDLALQNKAGNTALCFAAASGIKKIAEVMVNKNKTLPFIRGGKGATQVTPLYMAALLGHRDMVWYLYSVTEGGYLNEDDRIGVLIAAITSNLFDVALDIIQHHPELAKARNGNGDTALHVLARKPLAFYSGRHLGFLQRCIYTCIHVELTSSSLSPSASQLELDNFFLEVPRFRLLLWRVYKFIGMHMPSSDTLLNLMLHAVPGFQGIYEMKLMNIQALKLVQLLWDQVLLLEDSKIGELIRTPSRLLFTAAELGIVEFVMVLIRSYPDLIWKVNDQTQSIFHVAVAHRQEKIFNLIYEIGALKDLIAAYKDEYGTNMLHLAGKLAPSNRLKTDSGAALQLRRELLWFKEVEKIVQPLYTEMKDHEGRTPQTLFTEEHNGLLREGEKWMKDTASSCMLVATLIATVMFAAAFTVPGGYDNKSGKPIFISKRGFIVFTVSDALALFSSASSILMFLSILTSRYAEEDFLYSLPNRLIMGLVTLFVSITTMMIAFSFTLVIVLDVGYAWITIPMALAACVPVMLFACSQFPLFFDIFSHTYRSTTLFRHKKQLFEG